VKYETGISVVMAPLLPGVHTETGVLADHLAAPLPGATGPDRIEIPISIAAIAFH